MGLVPGTAGQYPEAEERANTCVHPAASVNSASTSAKIFLLSPSFHLFFLFPVLLALPNLAACWSGCF